MNKFRCCTKFKDNLINYLIISVKYQMWLFKCKQKHSVFSSVFNAPKQFIRASALWLLDLKFKSELNFILTKILNCLFQISEWVMSSSGSNAPTFQDSLGQTAPQQYSSLSNFKVGKRIGERKKIESCSDILKSEFLLIPLFRQRSIFGSF